MGDKQDNAVWRNKTLENTSFLRVNSPSRKKSVRRKNDCSSEGSFRQLSVLGVSEIDGMYEQSAEFSQVQEKIRQSQASDARIWVVVVLS